MKFSELVYTRPDAAELNAKCEQFEREAREAKDFAALDKVFCAFDAYIEDGFFTDYTLMNILRMEHTDNESYREELKYCGEADIENEPYRKRAAAAILNNPFAPELDKKYGAYPLRRMREWALGEEEPEELKELKKREQVLCDEYNAVMDGIRVMYRGKLCSQHDISVDKDDKDDAIRWEAWRASGEGYDSVKEELDRIFDELVHNRDAQAKKMGYKSYSDYSYKLKQRDFTRAEAETYRAAVVKYLVPLAEKLMHEQAERVGVEYPFSVADNMPFRDGYPKPAGTTEQTLAEVIAIFREMSPETSEYIDFLTGNGFIDAENRPNKGDTGFVEFIPRAKSPYLHSHPSGNIADVNSFTHEGGHAFAGYMNRLEPVSWRRNYSSETAETHSQSMELFFFPYEERLFGADADRYRHSHVADSVTSISYMMLVDHFQHIVYDEPDMTPEQRHETFRELMKLYRPWVKLDDGIPCYGDGHFWHRQPHIFLWPFYYIDYSLSEITALEFFALAQKDPEEAWKRYVAFVKKGGTENFVDLTRAAGLGSPFEEETVRLIGEQIGAWLDK